MVVLAQCKLREWRVWALLSGSHTSAHFSSALSLTSQSSRGSLLVLRAFRLDPLQGCTRWVSQKSPKLSTSSSSFSFLEPLFSSSRHFQPECPQSRTVHSAKPLRTSEV